MVSGFILAAGFGTRMGSLTSQTPKPMLPFAGAPLAAHSVFFLKQLGLQRIVLNLHYLGAKIEEGLKNIRSVELVYSHEESILGTAGGIRQALAMLESDLILIMNPDVILWPDGVLWLQRLESSLAGGDALLFVSRRSGSETGLRLENNGELHFDANGPDYYIGCALMRASVFTHLQPGKFAELGELWRSLDARGLLRGMRFEGKILDMGSEVSYKRNRDCEVPQRLVPAWRTFLKELQ